MRNLTIFFVLMLAGFIHAGMNKGNLKSRPQNIFINGMRIEKVVKNSPNTAAES